MATAAWFSSVYGNMVAVQEVHSKNNVGREQDPVYNQLSLPESLAYCWS
jgi:hypothetical protein